MDYGISRRFLAIPCFSIGKRFQLGFESGFTGFIGLERTSSV